jgi:type II secretory pathway component PulC
MFGMIIIGPLWFLNLILVTLNMILIVFLGITNDKIKIDFSLKNIQFEKIILTKSDIPTLNEITDRDIFNTIMPTSNETKIFVFEPRNLVNILYPPSEPEIIPIQNNIIIEKEILPPLQIVLHGTIISDNPLTNKAFIENVRTKEEKDYIIGDIIEDAQLVYINKHKVSLIRSNGQEENIYINKILKIEEEAILNTPWNKVIRLDNNNVKIINLDLFNYKIKSLNSFIDELNIITIFDKNIALGCLIQNAEEGSLGNALGFEKNDIILSINNILVNETQLRLEIYDLIIKNKNDDNFFISVNIKRNDQVINFLFKLEKNKKKTINKTMGILKINESKARN